MPSADHHSSNRHRAIVIAAERFEIRACREDDLEDLYKICLATGASGADASNLHADPKLIGHIYAAPYARFSRECSLVVEDSDGVGGYILGALDTRAFEALLEDRWWPGLRPLYVDPVNKPPDEWSHDEMRSWQVHHPRRTPSRVCGPYPSHLHIDLLPRLQGHGVGRQLMDRWLASVRNLGSVGAHLGVGAANARALRFYRAYGWRELDPRTPPASVIWFGMTL